MSDDDDATLTRADVAVLSMLSRGPCAVKDLPPATLFADFTPPTPEGIAARLGQLARLGIVYRTDSGGPKRGARRMWASTDRSEAIVAARRQGVTS